MENAGAKLGHTWIIKTNLTTANPITRSNIHEQHLIIPYCVKIPRYGDFLFEYRKMRTKKFLLDFFNQYDKHLVCLH